jgi:hypothetical protein
MRGEGGQLLGEALSAVRSRRPSRQRGSRAGTGQQAAGPSTARSDQSMRPHAWVVTHSVGPGAPWFVCLSVRLRSDLVRRSFGDRSGATAGASLRSDPAPPSRQTRRSGRSADGGDDPPRAEDVRSLRARRGAAAPPPVEVRDSEGIAMSLTGAWRIVEMDLWDPEAIDLLVPGCIQFGADGSGRFRFVAVQGWMDCHRGQRDGRPYVEFTWEGDDDGDPASGRGWAALEETVRCVDTSTFTLATTRASERCAPRRRGAAGHLPRRGGEQDGSPDGQSLEQVIDAIFNPKAATWAAPPPSFGDRSGTAAGAPFEGWDRRRGAHNQPRLRRVLAVMTPAAKEVGDGCALSGPSAILPPLRPQGPPTQGAANR